MKNKKQSLAKYSKEELIDKFRELERDFQALERAHQRALRTVASYRNVLQLEFKASQRYWDEILDKMIDEEIQDFEDPIPADSKIPRKKKDIEGYC